MRVVDELKAKKIELIERIASLQAKIGALEHQKAAFDTIIKIYDPEYVAEDMKPRARKPSKVSASAVTPLLKGMDKRGTLLRLLREANGPLSTGDCAKAVALQLSLQEDDARLGQIGNVLSRDLDKLVQNRRVRHAGVVEGGRRLWELMPDGQASGLTPFFQTRSGGLLPAQ